MKPGLYKGSVIHTRLKPVKHRLRYPVFYLLLDVDDPADNLRLLSHNRANLMSFRDRDHGPGVDAPLKPWLTQLLRTHGIHTPIGKAMVLTLPRILGYVFNPLSVYFCHDAEGRLFAIAYEVNNTFGERHTYVVATPTAEQARHHQTEKRLYVSPFNDVSGSYRFDITPPGDTVRINIHHRDEEGPLLFAALDATRQPLTDGALVRNLMALPLLTVRIIFAIHWQAWKLWRKGLRIKPRPISGPRPPTQPANTDTPLAANSARHL